jgi:hypothetical protein
MAASLVVSTLVVGVWVRSYVVGDAYQWVRVHERPGGLNVRSWGFRVGMGGLLLFMNHQDTSDAAEAQLLKARIEGGMFWSRPGYSSTAAPRYPVRPNAEESTWANLGFYGRNAVVVTPQLWRRSFSMTVPFWALFTLATAYPIWRYIAGVVQRQREDRLAVGLCPRCGVAVRDEFLRCPGCDRQSVMAARQHASLES